MLLDANISQKVARALWRELKLDVLSLRAQRLDDLPDGDVVRMAIATNRIIVTMDRDFAEYFHSATRIDVGIVYLNLSNRLRNIAGITRALSELFMDRARWTLTLNYRSSSSPTAMSKSTRDRRYVH